MGALCGIVGQRKPAVVERMTQALRHRAPAWETIAGDHYVVAGSRAYAAGPCLVDGLVSSENAPWMDPEALHAHAGAVARPQSIKLRGQFASALYHVRSGQWWFVRDRAGVKPLYYYVGADYLLFASELKALLATDLVPRRLNLRSVDRYLTLRCVPGPESIIQGVRRVQPGHVLRYDNGQLSETPYYAFCLESQRTTRDAAADELRARLRDAVARYDADAMLWGAGLDSATLAVLRPDVQPVYVSLEKGWRDESRQAEESASALGRRLTSVQARRLTESAFAHVASSLDEPMADAAVLPLSLILQRAAEQGTQIISGHGADQLFGGYPRYRLLEKTREARLFVPSRLVTEVLPALPPNAFIRRGSRYLARIRDNYEAYLSLLSVFDAEEREDLYTSAMKSALHEQGDALDGLRHHFQSHDMTENVLALDLHVGLPDLLLAECDRLAAAYGVALHFPYLDDDLVDFITAIPSHVKFGVRSKSLLRHAMKGLVPARIRLRPQRGFRVPDEGRVMSVIDRAAADVLSQDRVESAGIFRWQYVEQVLRAASHNIYRKRQFWSLLMFFAWYREAMES